jgi:hypothetical protein
VRHDVTREFLAAVTAAVTVAATSQLVTQPRSFHAARTLGSGSSAGAAEVTLSYVQIVSAPSAAARSSLTLEVSKFVLADPFSRSQNALAAPSPQALAADFFADYSDYYASSTRARVFVQPYVLDRKVRVLNSGPHVIALQMDETSDTGGAHINRLTEFSNVDARSGRVLSPNDLIVPGGKATFMQIAERYFRRARGIPLKEPFSEQDLFFSTNRGEFVLPNAIGVAADGLHFHYNTYEVASFADGPTDFTIPYGALRGILRSDLP